MSNIARTAKRSKIQWGRFWTALVVFVGLSLVVTACGAPIDEPGDKKQEKILGAGPDNPVDPSKWGPYKVGVTTWKLTDETRKGKDGKPRPLVIEVWYPTVNKPEPKTMDVFDVLKDAPPATLAKLKEVMKDGETLTLKHQAYRDSAPLKGQGKYPVILFSHGSGGIRYQSVYQTAFLASHGYIVASADHEGNTLYNLVVDEDARNAGGMIQAAVDRPLDVKFVYNELKKRTADEKSPFHNLINTDVVGVTGHSFGGMTSVMMTFHLFKEGVLKAIAPQTPHTSLTSAQGVTAQHLRPVPIMVLGSKEDKTLDYTKEQYDFYKLAIKEDYMRADRYMVTLNRGGHYNFSDICELDLAALAERLNLGSSVASLLNDGCGKENIDPKLGHQLINHYNTAFFNKYLRKDDKASEYLKQVDSNEVTFEQKLYKK